MNKILRKILASLLTVVMLLGLVPVMGLEVLAGVGHFGSVGELKWDEIDGEMSVYCDDILAEKVEIPSEIEAYSNDVYPVTRIQDEGFSACDRLKEILISESVKEIGVNAFKGTAYYENQSNWENGFLYIGNWLIDVKENTSGVYTVKKGTTHIADGAFEKLTNLTSINLPDTILTLSDSSVYNEKYFNNEANWENGALYIGNCLIKVNDELDEVYTVKDGTKIIAKYAFSSYDGNFKSNVIKVILPESLECIGDRSFFECTGLTECLIPEKVETIGNSAFRKCTSLKEIAIPDSITCLYPYAFSGCISLESVTIGSGVKTISEGMFSGSGLKTVNLSYGVLNIGDGVFSDCEKLESISIPNSVKHIGSEAFFRCNSLRSIMIPDSVTSLGFYVFEECKNLINVTIGKGLNNVDYDMFRFCDSISSITVDDDNQCYSSDSNGVLYNKNKTELILYPVGNLRTNMEIPDGVEMIGDYAFQQANHLVSVTIPESVSNIGTWSFAGCTRLTKIKISDSITNIGTSAFVGTGYYNDATNWEDSVLYLGKYLIATDYENLVGNYIIRAGTKLIADNAFSYCNGLTSVTIPDSVTHIGRSAFRFCEDELTSLTIPDSVISIGDEAFLGCENLVNVILSNSIKRIGDELFAHCQNLESIIIPNGVTSIGYASFISCQSLECIALPDSVINIGDYAFSYTYRLTSISIPYSVTSIGLFAFDNCYGLKNILVDDDNQYYCNDEYGVLYNKNKTELIKYPPENNLITKYKIPDSVIKINSQAFDNCDYLTSIMLPSGVTSIEYGTFNSCDNLTNITIPDSVTSIGNYAFSFCVNMESVSIGKGVTDIGSYAFEDCTSLTSITIPDSVTTIGDGAFCDCDSLTSVTIGDGVTTIGDVAFYYCDSLTSIDVSVDNTVYSSVDGVLFNKDQTTLIQYPNGKTATSYTIPDSVTTIGDDAFRNCDSLTSVTIGDGVTNVGYWAFNNCTSLESIEIPDSVTTISYSAFYSCDDLNDVYYNGTEEEWNKIIIGEENDALLNATIHFLGEDDCVHVYSSSTTTEATCTQEGLMTYTCDHCGDIYTEAIKKKEHSLNHIIMNPACETEGYEYDECTVCHEIFNENTVPAGSHNTTHIVIDSTCTVAGMEYDICTVCGETFNPDVLPLADHDFEHIKVDSTCKVAGEEYDVCSVCGKTFNSKKLPLAPHLWGEWSVTKEATSQAEGEEARLCSVCGKEETRVIPKLLVIKDESTGIEIEYSDEYESGVEVDVTEVYDGSSFQLIEAAYGENAKSTVFDISTVKDGIKVQPSGKVKVRIPLPEGFGTKDIFVCYLDSTNRTVTNIPATIVDGYVEFEAEHFSYYAVVEKLGKVNSVSIDNITVNYKDSATITPSINADAGVGYTVSYSSSDNSVAQVDANGKVTATGRGDATITCTVTDEYGNTVTDTCKVEVKYSWWQWIIVIVLFGWIWY